MKSQSGAAGKARRPVGFVAGMLLVTILIAFSFLPGSVAFLLGLAVGAPLLIVLAILATKTRPRSERTASFYLGVWAIPAIVLAGALILIVAEVLAARV